MGKKGRFAGQEARKRVSAADRSLRSLVSLTFILVLALLAGPLQAKAGLPVAGEWKYAGDKEEDRKRVASIEAATNELGILKRGQARKQLAKRTKPAPRINLSADGRLLVLVRDGRSVRIPLDHSPVRVEADGDAATLHARRDGDRIVVSAKTEKGESTTTYQRKGKGLVISVKIQLSGLSQPVSFSMTYSLSAG